MGHHWSAKDASGTAATTEQPPPLEPTPFDVRVSHRADATILELVGEIDLATAPELTRALELVSASTPSAIVDLSAVSFIDSTGLYTLLRAQRDLAARGVSLHLVSPARSVARRVLELTSLTGQLAVVDSIHDALPKDVA